MEKYFEIMKCRSLWGKLVSSISLQYTCIHIWFRWHFKFFRLIAVFPSNVVLVLHVTITYLHLSDQTSVIFMLQSSQEKRNNWIPIWIRTVLSINRHGTSIVSSITFTVFTNFSIKFTILSRENSVSSFVAMRRNEFLKKDNEIFRK